MVRLPRATAVAALAIGLSIAPAVAAQAAGGTCEAYSQNCPQVQGKQFHKATPPTVVLGEHFALPFTGADVALMSLAGGVALGGGTLMIVAGRRRRAAA
ncbi:MAG TPA: hypothetical protein VNG13_12845 [Mycobacteriales bacterium]|nr:hypothetical protein [Mycobacteriales bacterium]